MLIGNTQITQITVRKQTSSRCRKYNILVTENHNRTITEKKITIEKMVARIFAYLGSQSLHVR
jgi:hypothetical protein